MKFLQIKKHPMNSDANGGLNVKIRKPRILIVEDETDVLIMNKNYLEAQGYEVTTAQTLKDAGMYVIETPPDLILLDVQMPDGSGYDFCTEIRSVTSAPIIFLTCMDQNANIVQGLSGGGDDYITKPYDLNVLSARVVAQLRRAGLQGAGRIDMPPLYINLQNGTATLNDEPVLLTQKELQILAYLVSHAGRECSPSQLYEAVQGSPSLNSAHTIAVHISNIRNKLKLGDDSAFEIRSTKNKNYVLLKVSYE
jgi:DNA-binding response OmpR family regulator